MGVDGPQGQLPTKRQRLSREQGKEQALFTSWPWMARCMAQRGLQIRPSTAGTRPGRHPRSDLHDVAGTYACVFGPLHPPGDLLCEVPGGKTYKQRCAWTYFTASVAPATAGGPSDGDSLWSCDCPSARRQVSQPGPKWQYCADMAASTDDRAGGQQSYICSWSQRVAVVALLLGAGLVSMYGCEGTTKGCPAPGSCQTGPQCFLARRRPHPRWRQSGLW